MLDHSHLQYHLSRKVTASFLLALVIWVGLFIHSAIQLKHAPQNSSVATSLFSVPLTTLQKTTLHDTESVQVIFHIGLVTFLAAAAIIGVAWSVLSWNRIQKIRQL